LIIERLSFILSVVVAADLILPVEKKKAAAWILWLPQKETSSFQK